MASSEDYEEFSIERILEIVTGLSVVSEEDRESLRKLLIKRTGSGNVLDPINENGSNLDPPIQINQRLTYDPTDYEYYLFFLIMAFVIGVFGKNNNNALFILFYVCIHKHIIFKFATPRK